MNIRYSYLRITGIPDGFKTSEFKKAYTIVPHLSKNIESDLLFYFEGSPFIFFSVYEERGKLSKHLSPKGNFIFFEGYKIIKVLFKKGFLFVVEVEKIEHNEQGYADRKVFVKAIKKEDRE